MYHYGGTCSGSLTPRLRKVQRQRHIPPTSQLKKLSLSLCNLVNRSRCGGECRHSRGNRRGRGHRCPRHRRDNRSEETSLARRNRYEGMYGKEVISMGIIPNPFDPERILGKLLKAVWQRLARRK